MPYLRMPIVINTFLSVLLLVFAGSRAEAQNKGEIAEACMAAIEAGDLDKVNELSGLMADWRSLFATKTIRQAEQCLQTGTGAYWQYFTTKGRFLSEEEARAELDYISNAGGRRAAKAEEVKRLSCQVTVALEKLSRLEAEFKNIQQARAGETLRATMVTCTKIYETDQTSALLEPVCNDIFMRIGVPDTGHAFEYWKLEDAKLELALASLKLNRSNTVNAVVDLTDHREVTQCKELLAK